LAVVRYVFTASLVTSRNLSVPPSRATDDAKVAQYPRLHRR
jgi:hypothetical protein